VFRLAFSLVHDRDIADDLAQEAFIRAYLSLSKFQQKSEFGTWLYRITVNHTKDYLRKKTRRKEVPLEDFAISQEKETLTPEKDREEEQKKTILYRSLEELPEKYRLILTLRDQQGFSYKEIAKILKISPGTVDSRLHRAREMLRKKVRSFLERRQP
jgi:RNA polymerase sigma-70 factor (ECF subfamily)